MESTLSDLSGVPDTTFAGALKQTITDNLSAHNRIDSTNDTLRKASVGIIVVENDKGEAGFMMLLMYEKWVEVTCFIDAAFANLNNGCSSTGGTSCDAGSIKW